MNPTGSGSAASFARMPSSSAPTPGVWTGTAGHAVRWLMARPVTGLLPAAGIGRRLGRHGFIKELFPPLEPRPVCDFALERIAAAGAARCVVVIAPQKVEILRQLEGERRGMALAYA